MARYRIYRIKDSPKESFRWAAHMGGLTIVKPKDYEVNGEVEAATPYAAWSGLANGGQALCPGDLLEMLQPDGSAGDLRIAKYIGFEPAQWFVPETKAAAGPEFGASSTIATPVSVNQSV
ncbi:MAG TPA: hypothetical protein VGL97_05980 [Bryobacteraceae bacterium]|jgi:hypothetical protein